MRNKNIVRMIAVCMAAILSFSPVGASAAALRIGSSGSEVKQVQAMLRDLGYFTYSRLTGYYGSITKSAVKKFQKDQGILADGIVGSITKKALSNKESDTDKSIASVTTASSVSSGTSAENTNTSSVSADKIGALDWFTKVQYIFKKGDVAKVTDIDTGKTFYLKRTFGHNHADVEPLTKNDTDILFSIWGNFSWNRRAVIVEVNGYILAGSLNFMPHAGVDSAPALSWLSKRSGGYGYGQNLDAVKHNGVSGVMDLHFKNSRTHGTNSVSSKHQAMVAKAARYIEKYFG